MLDICICTEKLSPELTPIDILSTIVSCFTFSVLSKAVGFCGGSLKMVPEIPQKYPGVKLTCVFEMSPHIVCMNGDFPCVMIYSVSVSLSGCFLTKMMTAVGV